MNPAAKTETVFPLAAFFQLAEKPHPGHQLPTGALYPAITLAISNTATGLCDPLYDFRRRPRSTSKERDAETGLDFFGARYFSSAQGRFTSPDWSDRPEPIPYADLRDPQTLNLYTYGHNNPLRYTDPDGHCTADGEEHGWLWCAAHSVGLVQTKKEVDQTQQQWANLGAQEYAKAHPGFDPNAYSQQQIRQMWDNGVFSKTKDDPLDPLQLLGMVTVFRGGPGLNVRSNDVKVDSNGMVQPGRGVSVNTDPASVSKFGGAYEVESVPNELEVVQRGQNSNHYEIAPKQPMTLQRYQELLQQVKLKPPTGK